MVNTGQNVQDPGLGMRGIRNFCKGFVISLVRGCGYGRM